MNAANRKNVPGNHQGQSVMNQEGQGYMNAAMAAAGNQGLGYTTVPMGWNRTIWGDGSVVYVSPSGHLLHCADELQRYLLAEGTCKCGLECPLIIDRVFNFNPRVPARPKLPSDILQRSHLQTLCKHRHKLVAMAAGLQGNEESLTNIGPPGGGLAAPGRSKGVKRARSKSKPETGGDFQYPNLSVSQILALQQGRHQHHPQNITKHMPSMESIPYDHRLHQQQHSLESHQRQAQMRFLHMQHQELMQQHQQQQLLLHHQQLTRQASPRRGSQESLHSPIDQCSVEHWDGRVLHSSPTLRCPNIPFTRGAEVAPQNTPTAASPHNTVSRSRKRSGSSGELTVSPNEMQTLHNHGSFSFPFHGEVHGPVVDGQNMVGMHLDGCSPSVIPLLSNMYHNQNRASSTAANMSNNPALFANRNDVAFYMQDRSKKSLVVPGQDSEEAAPIESTKPVDKSKADKMSTSVTPKDSNPTYSIKSSSMHNTKTDPKLPVGNISLQEIFNQSLEGSAFPASSLLSAAAKAQSAKQSQPPESPAPHHAGDLMSGMGLFNDNTPNVTPDSSKHEIAPSQISAKRKQSVESLKLSDAAVATETSSEGSTSAVENISESPIQCLENAVLNLEDQPHVANVVPFPEGATFSPERKRINTKSIEDAIDGWTKRPRLHSSDSSHGRASVESETIQSEVALSTHKVPEMNTDRLFLMHQYESTKVTGSYNVVCSTGKSTNLGEHQSVDELARLKKQQEWCAAMIRANQQHGTGNVSQIEQFPTDPQMGLPHIRSRGLQELQHIAMGGGPFPRMPGMQQHPNYAQTHQFPNRFINPQFVHPKMNVMQHPRGMPRPFRLDTPVEQIDPKIQQGANMCNSNILQSMLQQQQQQHLQQLGIPPGNFHHPGMKQVCHGEPSMPMKQFPDVVNLTKTHQHGSATHKSGTSSQRRKTTKVLKSTGGSSTGGTPVVDLDDEEPKDAAYWVKAASKVGGVKKVKDILAMTRSLKKHNSESGQVEAIFEAVLDSASGGMKVIIKEGTRAQQGSTDQGKGSDSKKTLVKETIPTSETSEVSNVINVKKVSAELSDPSELHKSEISSPNTELNAGAGHERETPKEYLQTTFKSGSQFAESDETKDAAITLLDLGSSNPNYLDNKDREGMTVIEEKSVLEMSITPMDTKSEDGATLESESCSPVLELREVQSIRSPCDEIVGDRQVCNTVPEQTVFPSVEHELVACESAGLETLSNQPLVELSDSQQTPTETLSLAASTDTLQSPNICADDQKSSEIVQNEDGTVTDSGEGQLHLEFEEDTDEFEVSYQTKRLSEEAISKSQEQRLTAYEAIPNTSSTPLDTSTSEQVDHDCTSDSCTEQQKSSLVVIDPDSKEEDPQQSLKDTVPKSTEEPRISPETVPEVFGSCSDMGSLHGEDSHMSSGNLSLNISTAEIPDAEVQRDLDAWCSGEDSASQHENDHASDQEDTVLVIALGECSDETGGLIEHTEPKSSEGSDTEVTVMEDQAMGSVIGKTDKDQQQTQKISETATHTIPIESEPAEQYQSKDIQSMTEGETMDSEPGNETIDKQLVEEDQSMDCESVKLDGPSKCEPVEQGESLDCEPVKQKQPSELEPVKKDQAMDCEPVKQEQSPECEPVKEEQSSECEPEKQSPSSSCEPENEDQSVECEPVKERFESKSEMQNQSLGYESLKQDQSLECEQVKLNQSSHCEPVHPDHLSECELVNQVESSECEPVKEDQSVDCAPVQQDESLKCVPVKQDQSSDRAPVKEDQSSDCEQVKQDNPLKCEPVKQDQSVECAPVKLDQLPECEPVKQDESLHCDSGNPDQSSDCLPVKQDQVPECEPVNPDESSRCEPVKLDQAMECEPVKQDLVMDCEPFHQDRATESEPLEKDHSFESEAVMSAPTMECEPFLQDQASKSEPMTQDEGYDPSTSNDKVLTVDQVLEGNSKSEDEFMDHDSLETDQPVDSEHMTHDCITSREQSNLTQNLEQSGEVKTSVQPMDREQAVSENLRDDSHQCPEDYNIEPMDEGESLHADQPVRLDSESTISNSMKQDSGPVTRDHLTVSELGKQNLVTDDQPEETESNAPVEDDTNPFLENDESNPVGQEGEQSEQGDEVEPADSTHLDQVPLLETVKGNDLDEATVLESHLVENHEVKGEDTSVDIESQNDEDTSGLGQDQQSHVVLHDAAVEESAENTETVAQDHLEETERDSSSGHDEPNIQDSLGCCESVEQSFSELDNTEPERKVFDTGGQSTLSPQAEKIDEPLEKEQEPVQVSMVYVQAMDQNELLKVDEAVSENVFRTNHNIREDNVNNNRSTESLPYEDMGNFESGMSSADSEFQSKSTPALSNTAADVLLSDLQEDSEMAPEKSIEEVDVELESKLESIDKPEVEPLETIQVDLSSTESDSGAHRSSPSPAVGDDCPLSPTTHSSQELGTDDISTQSTSELLSFDDLITPSASNGPSSLDTIERDSSSEVFNHCEMAEASDSLIENSLEPFKDRSSPFEPASNKESGLPNGLVEPQRLDDIPVGSLAGQTSDHLNQDDVAGVGRQSGLDDEQENRENTPLVEEPSVQEICTVRREPILKRTIGETPKSMMSAKEAGFKKERLTTEAPTRVLRGNVRTDPSSEFSSSMFPRHLEIGDLVWGPIRGYPSWPGKLVSEAEVRGRSRREEGKMWVRWFGDHSCTQVEPEKLKTLSEGLEAHHSARQSNRSRGRRLNSTLEAAIQEAMNELDKKMEQAKESKMKPVPKSSKQKTRCKRLR
ncbi:uncharacterized protein LOC117287928 isoform X2 [Asterias rubens]|uniref:uncharacterized protein LOC117287928 isoform X2 n=1 Tax=Asterias rubens TaxID=7604 RepID=UPI0014553D83|nr:uncharacterized protein LOC117287928 isoform X2 [Asterias rubens]